MGIIPADPTNANVLLRSWVYLPELFFKDEGSKDRCMEAEVALVAANKETPAAAPMLVTGIKLHLNVQLVYVDFVASPEYCSSGGRRRAGGTQLLHISPATVRHIDPATGRAKIKFRVNDVSKNHDGRFFRLAIAADLSDSLSGEARALMDGPVVASQVAPGYTHAIEVRSKRRKTKGKSAAGSSAASLGDFEDSRDAARALSSSSAGLVAAASALLGDVAAPIAAAAAQRTHMHAPPHAAAGMSGGIEGVPRGPVAKHLRRCMNEVVNWSNNVLDLLQHKLQWHTFQSASGKAQVHCIMCSAQSDDPSTASHFPDCKLRGAVTQYAESTRESITALVRHVHGEQNTLAAQRKAQIRKTGAIPAARSNSLENELGGHTSVPRHTGLSSGLSPHDTALTEDAVQSLVQLRNSPPVPPGPPPALSRDESVGTMFVRVAQQSMQVAAQGGHNPLLQHSSSSSSVGHTFGGGKRSRGGSSPPPDAAKRHASASAREGRWGEDMGPAGLERESSRASYSSMGGGGHHGGGVHDLLSIGTSLPPGPGGFARVPSGVLPPQPPTLMQQSSFARQESGGWPMQFSRQDSAGSWGSAPAARVHGGASVPLPPASQPFLRGHSSSSGSGSHTAHDDAAARF